MKLAHVGVINPVDLILQETVNALAIHPVARIIVVDD